MPEYWCYKAGKAYKLEQLCRPGHLQSRAQFGPFLQHLYQFSGSIVTILESVDLIIVNSVDSYLEGNEELDLLLDQLQTELVILEKWTNYK